MDVLSHCIVCLLAENDCVILPGIGGFISSREPARYDSGSRTFYSPRRALGFNGAITLNDGLMVQAYMQVYGLSYPDALRTLEKDLRRVRRELDGGGSFRIEGLGALTGRKGGACRFEADSDSMAAPGLYALPEITAETLPAGAAPPEEKPRAPREAPSAAAKGAGGARSVYTFSLRRSFVHAAGALLLSVAAFLCISFPLGGGRPGKASRASLLDGVVYAPSRTPDGGAGGPAEAEGGGAAERAPRKEAEAPAVGEGREAAPAAGESGEGGYTIVLASDVSEKNAENFVASLRMKGFAEAEVHNTRTMRRVVFSRYGSKEEAVAAMRGLRGNSFAANAWVMKIK